MDAIEIARINRGLAEAIGFVDPAGLRPTANTFSPATDMNHLREYVLPEVERRKVWEQFVEKVMWASGAPGPHPGLEVWNALKQPTSTLAAAALEVLTK